MSLTVITNIYYITYKINNIYSAFLNVFTHYNSKVYGLKDYYLTVITIIYYITYNINYIYSVSLNIFTHYNSKV